MKTSLKYLTTLLGVLILPATALAVPQIPHLFHGEASLNGAPLQISTTINARVDGNLVGSVTLQNSGEYGGPDAYDQKLVVQGNVSNGDTINFFTSGVKANETASFESGKVKKLDLTFTYTGGNISGNTVESEGDNDVSLDSEEEGVAQLPPGANNVSLTNDTDLDLSQGVFESENEKRVKIKSSTGEDIEISNSENSKAKVSIPNETTITSEISWDGKMQAPKDGDSSGDAPSGYQIGDTVIEVGSASSILNFNKAVKLTLEGVTGAVGYKSAGSNTWTQITTQCNSATDHSNISAPNECYYQTGGNTIIWTYHFTTFAALTEEDTDGETAGETAGGGGGGYTPPATYTTGDIDENGAVDIFDFNTLMVNWGDSPTNSAADLDGNGKVDIFDFNLLMVNWG